METAHTNVILNSRKSLSTNRFNQVEAFLENIPYLIYMKDLKGNFVTGTKNAKEFFHKGIDSANNIRIDLRKVRNTNNAEDEFVLKNGKTVNSEREIFDVNGIAHFYNIYKSPIFGINNNVIGIVVMVNNIDNSKLLETQKETFVASLGHDLKNPTIAQIRALELILQEKEFGEITPEQREILEMVLDSCRYMYGMLSSLLATYRNQKGVVRLNYEEFSLVDLVMECVDEMIYIAKDKEVGISIANTSTIPTVQGDKVQVKRVIMNLLSNGIKYAFRNSNLLINIYNEKEYTAFKFENNSPYIPPDKQESIFAQYVSYAEAHKELGIGLGLYASQKIVESHDGNIFVQSFKDDRNIFGFKLPNKVIDTDKPRTVVF